MSNRRDDNTIRVLRLTMHYSPVLGRSLESLAAGFSKDQRFELEHVVLEGDRNPLLEERLTCPVIWMGLKQPQVAGPTLPGLFRLWKFIRRNDYDLVITHRYKPARMMALIRPFLKLRGVISVWHDVGVFKRKGRALLARLLMQNNWYHVGVSGSVSQDLSRAGLDPGHVVTIQNSVDLEAIRARALPPEDAREALGIPHDRYLIGTLGQNVTRKGHKYLVGAMPSILNEIPNAHLVILGGGGDNGPLVRQVRELGLENRITLTGAIDSGFRYLPALDLYVMPSLREAFGIALIEAMTLGLPVLGSHVDGIPEVIGNEKLLFEPADTEQVYEAISWFNGLATEEREAFRKETSQRAEDLFNVDRYQREYLDLVSRIIKETTKAG